MTKMKKEQEEFVRKEMQHLRYVLITVIAVSFINENILAVIKCTVCAFVCLFQFPVCDSR